MSDDHNADGLLVIRASRDEDGQIEARVTHGTAGDQPSLEIANLTGAGAVLALVQQWLEGLQR